MSSFKLWTSLFCIALLALGQLPGNIAVSTEEMSESEETLEELAKTSIEEAGVDLQDSRRLAEEADIGEATEIASLRGATVNQLMTALSDALDSVSEGEEATKKEEALDPLSISVVLAKLAKFVSVGTPAVAKLVAVGTPAVAKLVAVGTPAVAKLVGAVGTPAVAKLGLVKLAEVPIATTAMAKAGVLGLTEGALVGGKLVGLKSGF
eukprot:GHVS01008721.1.p2 GENE.GHVS01008721.1~~GHVS01008721.1.p2  ORF type:complete len:208 (+),score=40.85 GHVS01008721.1:61-684(+)